MAFTAGSVMDRSAAYLNDASKSVYTYAVLLPYLKTAHEEMQIELQENGVPVLFEVSTTVSVAIGATTITSPSDLISPIFLQERGSSAEDWQDMEKKDWDQDSADSQYIQYWNWREQVIYIRPPVAAREVRIRYYKSLTTVTGESSSIAVNNAFPFLASRTAALGARFIGENPTRAAELDLDAAKMLQKLVNIEVKALQSLPVRPHPYGYSKGKKIVWNTPVQ